MPPDLSNEKDLAAQKKREDAINKLRYFMEYYNIGGRNPYMDAITAIAEGRREPQFEIIDFGPFPSEIRDFLMVDPFAVGCVEHAVLEIIGARWGPKQRNAITVDGGIKVKLANIKNAFAAIPQDVYLHDLPEDLAVRVASRKIDPSRVIDAVIKGMRQRNGEIDEGKLIVIGLTVRAKDYERVMGYCLAVLEEHFKKTGHKGFAEDLVQVDCTPQNALARRLGPAMNEAWVSVIKTAEEMHVSRVTGDLKKVASTTAPPLMEVPRTEDDDSSIASDENEVKQEE